MKRRIDVTARQHHYRIGLGFQLARQQRCKPDCSARLDHQFEDDKAVLPATGGAFAQTAVWLVIALTAANVVTTLMECGFGACADNPVVYELLKRGS